MYLLGGEILYFSNKLFEKDIEKTKVVEILKGLGIVQVKGLYF